MNASKRAVEAATHTNSIDFLFVVSRMLQRLGTGGGRRVRILYASGPGSLLVSHQHWRKGVQDPNLTAMTYSGQFSDFCKVADADAEIVSHANEPAFLREGKFTIAQAPKSYWFGY